MITGTELYNYTQCPARVYLNLFGDQSKKQPISDFMQQQFEKGRDHESKIVSEIEFEEPEYPAKDFKEGFKQTLNLMKKGADIIYQGILLHDNLLGIPDLLEKKKGISKLGDYYYTIKDIKLGLSMKNEYIAQLMLYSHLLEKIQGVMPEKAFVIFGDFKQGEFNTSERKEEFKDILSSIKSIAGGKKQKPSICRYCPQCVWQNYCHDWCVKHDDLSLIYRMTKKTKQLLIENKIRSISEASKMDAEKLSEVKGLGIASLKIIKNQALAMKKNQPIILKEPEFPRSKLEIYFDIEGETNLDVEYLWGILIKQNNKEKYRAFLANHPRDEEKTWKEFLNFFKDKEDFTIYHYHDYEKRAMKKMLSKYGGNNKIYGKITKNMVDLFKVITKSVILPLESYSIKHIAKYLNFRWSSEKAGGAQSMVWYNEFMKDPLANLAKLDLILQYNEEDCKATEIVKNFLEKLK